MTAHHEPTAQGPTAHPSPQALLREMFEQMVVPKNADLVERFYHPDFTLTTNGIVQGYAEYVRGHREVYATGIQYSIRYDEDSWVESGDRVAARMWITTTRPGQSPTEIEVVLIAAYLDGRLHRVWELTWPDWSRLDAFENYPGVDDPRQGRPDGPA